MIPPKTTPASTPPSDEVFDAAKKILAEQKDDEIIIERKLLKDLLHAVQSLGSEALEVRDLREALETLSVLPKLVAGLKTFWQRAVAPPVYARMSEAGLTSIARDAVSDAMVAVPSTLPTPNPHVLQAAMLALLDRLTRACLNN